MEHWRKIAISPTINFQFSGGSVRIGGGVQLEPRGCSPEWTMAGKIRDRRQIPALNI
jgi:hypothetical protein